MQTERGPWWLRSWNRRQFQGHDRRDLKRLKAILECAPAVPAAQARWRAILVFTILTVVFALVWATFRSLTSTA